MAGLLDWITGAVKQQYAQGAPYREAIGGLLQGDPTKFGLLAQEFNRKAQTPEGALDVALNFAPLGITAFHGSPASFEKFDLSKVGTGTGIQNYGHGLYFTESPELAKSYQVSKALDSGDIFVGKKKVTPKNLAEETALQGVRGSAFYDVGKDPIDAAIDSFTKSKGVYTDEARNIKNQQALDYLLKLKEKNAKFSPSGTIYKVDIKDEILPSMLEWEKPFSQQPKVVQDAFKKLQEEDPYLPIKGLIKDDAVGGAIMKTLPLEQTNKMLSAKGVTGVKYLDKNAGAKNYVVFDPEMIKILERKKGLLAD